MGWDEVPQAGDRFEVVEDDKTARSIAAERLEQARSRDLRVPTAAERLQGILDDMRSADQAAQIPLERFEDPIAAEYIHVQSPRDGYFRKYRYLIAGDLGVSVSLQIGKHWEVRGRGRDVTTVTRREEVSYLSRPDPNYQSFQQARRALGLDVVAFDYSYTPEGEPVVWEVNVLPDIGLTSDPAISYVNVGLRRSNAALVRLYLKRAGLPIPERLDEVVGTGQAPTRRAA